VAHVEDVVKEKDGALGGREPLEQHQERHRDLVDHLDAADPAFVQIDGLRQAIAPALLASRARRAELIEAQARDRRQQERLRRFGVTPAVLPAHPSLLHRVLRPRQIAEHPIGQRQQRWTVCFEGLGLVDHPRSLEWPSAVPDLETMQPAAM
jgi:hypothetical protein